MEGVEEELNCQVRKACFPVEVEEVPSQLLCLEVGEVVLNYRWELVAVRYQMC